MLDIVTQTVLDGGAILAIWLPVYGYQAAVRSIIRKWVIRTFRTPIYNNL